jgi:hypothetical protein
MSMMDGLIGLETLHTWPLYSAWLLGWAGILSCLDRPLGWLLRYFDWTNRLSYSLYWDTQLGWCATDLDNPMVMLRRATNGRANQMVGFCCAIRMD